jgi:hypothetical protein
MAVLYNERVTFGFPAFHEEDFTFSFPVTNDWIVYACQTAGLGPVRWGHGARGGAWYVAPAVSVFSWGEQIVIAPLAPNVVRIRSECSLPTQCIDWGKNKKNVMRLIQTLWVVQQGAQPPFR